MSDELLTGDIPENSLIKLYREELAKQGKKDPRSNAELTLFFGNHFRSSGDFKTEEKFEDFRDDFLNLKHRDRGSVLEELGKGISSGFESLKGTLKGTVALGADLLPGEDGFIDRHIRDPLLESAQENFEEADREAPTINRFEDVRGIGDLAAFVSGGFGKVVPSLAESAVAAGGGAIVGTATAGPGPGTVGGAIAGATGKETFKVVLRRAVQKLVKKVTEGKIKKKGFKDITNEQLEGELKKTAAELGVAGASFLNSWALSSGEIFNELAQVEGIDFDTARNTALSFGSVAAIPDSLLPVFAVRKFYPGIKGIPTDTQKKGAAKFLRGFSEKLDERFGTRIIKEGLISAGSGASLEGITEAFQELVNISAKKFAEGKSISESVSNLNYREISRLMNAGILGAIGGGGVSTIGTVAKAGQQIVSRSKDVGIDETQSPIESNETPDPISDPIESKNTSTENVENTKVDNEKIQPEELPSNIVEDSVVSEPVTEGAEATDISNSTTLSDPIEQTSQSEPVENSISKVSENFNVIPKEQLPSSKTDLENILAQNAGVSKKGPKESRNAVVLKNNKTGKVSVRRIWRNTIRGKRNLFVDAKKGKGIRFDQHLEKGFEVIGRIQFPDVVNFKPIHFKSEEDYNRAVVGRHESVVSESTKSTSNPIDENFEVTGEDLREQTENLVLKDSEAKTKEQLENELLTTHGLSEEELEFLKFETEDDFSIESIEEVLTQNTRDLEQFYTRAQASDEGIFFHLKGVVDKLSKLQDINNGKTDKQEEASRARSTNQEGREGSQERASSRGPEEEGLQSSSGSGELSSLQDSERLPPNVRPVHIDDRPEIDLNTGTVKQPEVRLDNVDGIDWTLSQFDSLKISKSELLITELDREFSLSTDALKYLKQFFDLVQESAQRINSPEVFSDLELKISPDPIGDLTKANPGGYDPNTNTLWINSEHALNQGNGLATTVVHEAGHFFTHYVIGRDFVFDQWQSLKPNQRARAWIQYLRASGDKSTQAKDLNGEALTNDEVAMLEWAAFQFTRVVRGGNKNLETVKSNLLKDGLDESFLDKLIQFYQGIRDLVKKWIGDVRLTTVQLDQRMNDLLGFSGENLNIPLVKPNGDQLKVISGAPAQVVANVMNRAARKTNEFVSMLFPNVGGYVDKGSVLTSAWSLHDELEVVNKMLSNFQADGKLEGMSAEEFRNLFSTLPTTLEDAEDFIDAKVIDYKKIKLEDLEGVDIDQYKRVSQMAAAAYSDYLKFNEKKLRSEQQTLENSIKEEEQLRLRVDNFKEHLDDAAVLVNEARRGLKLSVEQLVNTVRARGGRLNRLGLLGEIINSIEGEEVVSDLEGFAKRMKTILRDIQVNPMGFFDSLEAVAKSEIDFDRTSVREIRELFAQSGDPRLEDLANRKFGNLAAIIHIAKSNPHLMDNIVVRQLKDLKEKTEIVESEIRDLGLDEATAKDEIKEGEKGLLRNAKLLAKIQKHRALLNQKLSRTKKGNDKLRERIGVRNDLIKIFDRRLRERLEPLGAAAKGDLVEGSLILDPPNSDAPQRDILSNARPFTVKNGQFIANSEWQEIMIRIQDWLDNPNNKEDSFFYNTMERRLEKMKRFVATESWHNHFSFLKGLWLAPLSQRFKSLGTTGGNQVVKMLTRKQALTESWMNEGGRLGRKADEARSKLINEIGLTRRGVDVRDEFSDFIDTVSKKHLEDPGASFESLFAFLKESPATDLFKTKRSQDLLINYIKTEQAFTNWIKTITEEGGLQVTSNLIELIDPTNPDKGLTAIERLHLSIGAGNFMLGINRERIQALVEAMQQMWGNDEVFANLLDSGNIEQLFQDPNGNIQKWFIQPLLNKDKLPAFDLPVGQDGLRRDIGRAEIQDSWNRSGGNVTTFFENLYSIEQNAAQTFEEYLKDSILNLRDDYFRPYNNAYNDIQTANNNKFIPESAQHVAIDERLGELFPAELIRYRQSTAKGNEIMAASIAFHAAFGKDGKEILDTIGAVKSDLNKLVLEYKDVQERLNAWARSNPEATRREMDKMRKQFASSKSASLKQLQKAETQLRLVKSSEESLIKLSQSELGPFEDIKLTMEAVSLLISGILNGPRSALVQFYQLAQPFLFFGAGGTSRKLALNQAKFAAMDLFGSFFQLLGQVVNENNQEFQLQKELFGADADIGTPFWASLFSDYGPNGRLREPTISNKLQRFFRVLGGITRQGVSKANEERALYSSFKPWAPFSQFVGALNKGAMMATRSSFNRLAMNAIKYMNDNPDAFNDLDFKLKPEMVGYRKDSRAFEQITTILAQDIGVTLERVAREAIITNREKPFTNDQYKLISSVGLQYLASEANYLTTRPTILTEGAVASLASPLLGWAVNQQNNFVKAFKTPDGEVNIKAIQGGLLAIGFGVLPVTLALSLFQDWFDEEIMGKKNNIRPLFDADNWGKSTVERVVKSGIVGLPGEFANLMVNVGGDGGDLRTASLDQRVLVASTLRNLLQVFGTVANQGWRNSTWSSVGRPFFQTLGGNGALQQFDIFSNLLDIDNPETRYINRTNARNWLRTGGRMMGLEVRSSSGAFATPRPYTPWVTQMILSAYANDDAGFTEAMRNAIQAARDDGKTDPLQTIIASYRGRHPLKVLFRSPPTKAQVQALLLRIGKTGRRDVSEALQLYNIFGKRYLDLKEFMGKEGRKKSKKSHLKNTLFFNPALQGF